MNPRWPVAVRAAAGQVGAGLIVTLVAVIAVWLCNALAVRPPGAYVFALACAAVRPVVG